MNINKEIERVNRLVNRGKHLLAYKVMGTLIDNITSSKQPTDKLLSLIIRLENKRDIILAMVR